MAFNQKLRKSPARCNRGIWCSWPLQPPAALRAACGHTHICNPASGNSCRPCCNTHKWALAWVRCFLPCAPRCCWAARRWIWPYHWATAAHRLPPLCLCRRSARRQAPTVAPGNRWTQQRMPQRPGKPPRLFPKKHCAACAHGSHHASAKHPHIRSYNIAGHSHTLHTLYCTSNGEDCKPINRHFSTKFAIRAAICPQSRGRVFFRLSGLLFPRHTGYKSYEPRFFPKAIRFCRTDGWKLL